MSLVEEFANAQERVKILAQRPDNLALLQLYSLFKQVTAGDASTGKKPGMLDFVAKAKYEAWEAHQGKTKDQAMTEYIALVDELEGKNLK